MPRIRAVAILIVFLTSTLLLIPWQAFLLRFKFKRRKTFPSSFNRYLCRLFGIRITVIGKPIQDRGVLMVANHTSYFDILILSGLARISFVAKSEVAGWPLFGTLAKLQQAVFVERAKRTQAVEAKDQIRERLVAGDALVLFPEGTSNDGNRVLTFKSALMGAVETEMGTDAQGRPLHVPVQPVSLAYVGMHGLPMGRENRPLYAWYGDMELVPHLWEALVSGPIEVVVEFHAPITVDTVGGRKALAARVEAIVRRAQAHALAGKFGGDAADAAIGVEKGELAEAAA
ncbi:MAG: lysophospholipid acyltransferase family protein [Rhizomicrobium sp.]|jgi:1-acyl-sn-glycerol-3-phosphate acyltransferase